MTTAETCSSFLPASVGVFIFIAAGKNPDKTIKELSPSTVIRLSRLPLSLEGKFFRNDMNTREIATRMKNHERWRLAHAERKSAGA